MKRIIITSALISLSLLTVVSCGKKDSSGYSVVVPTAPEKGTAAVSENVQESTDAASSTSMISPARISACSYATAEAEHHQQSHL